MKALLLALALLAPFAALAQIAPPDLIHPEDGGTRFTDDVQEWTEVPGAVGYRAEIDTLGGDFSTVFADTLIAGTQWAIRLPDGFYMWRVAATDGNAWSAWSEVWTFQARFPVANEPTAVPRRPVLLESVSPNPSRGAVRVRFSVPPGETADLRVYDPLGREVARLYHGPTTGAREVRWDTKGLPAGTYLLHLRTASGAATERVSVAR